MNSLFMGKCLGPALNRTIKVLVPNLKFNSFFNMYFREGDQLLADDSHGCNAGDWILVRRLDQPLSLRVSHSVHRIIYRAGHVIDPLSGKQCLGYEYVSDADNQSLLFGLKPPLQRSKPKT